MQHSSQCSALVQSPPLPQEQDHLCVCSLTPCNTPRAHTYTHACALARAGAGVANHIVAGALRQREADLRAAFAAEAQAARLAHEAEKEALREVKREA